MHEYTNVHNTLQTTVQINPTGQNKTDLSASGDKEKNVCNFKCVSVYRQMTEKNYQPTY